MCVLHVSAKGSVAHGLEYSRACPPQRLLASSRSSITQPAASLSIPFCLFLNNDRIIHLLIDCKDRETGEEEETV